MTLTLSPLPTSATDKLNSKLNLVDSTQQNVVTRQPHSKAHAMGTNPSSQPDAGVPVERTSRHRPTLKDKPEGPQLPEPTLGSSERQTDQERAGHSVCGADTGPMGSRAEEAAGGTQCGRRGRDNSGTRGGDSHICLICGGRQRGSVKSAMLPNLPPFKSAGTDVHKIDNREVSRSTPPAFS